MRVSTGRTKSAAITAIALVVAALTACSSDGATTGPDAQGRVSLQALAPANGVTGVSITMPMVMQFSGAVGAGMEKYVAIHEGTITGPVVAGRWSWSTDGRTLTFAPDAPLKARTSYVIHMGGGMQGRNGTPLDYAACVALGGRGVSGAMMGGAGMMGGSAGMMGDGGTGMMGPGWQGAAGGYGMTFTFTTA